MRCATRASNGPNHLGLCAPKDRSGGAVDYEVSQQWTLVALCRGLSSSCPSSQQIVQRPARQCTTYFLCAQLSKRGRAGHGAHKRGHGSCAQAPRGSLDDGLPSNKMALITSDCGKACIVSSGAGSPALPAAGGPKGAGRASCCRFAEQCRTKTPTETGLLYLQLMHRLLFLASTSLSLCCCSSRFVCGR